MKFFFSYSRSVKQEVYEVIKLLRAAGHDVWWDADIPESEPWWSTILDKIEWCDVFVFMVSEKAAQSPYCLGELQYAVELNLPVLPFVGLDDHNAYPMPEEIVRGHYQWFTYDRDPARTLERLQDACGKINWQRYTTPKHTPRRIPEPNTGSDSLIKRFHQAAQLAENGHFKKAIQRFREVRRDDGQRWGQKCDTWINQINLYVEIAELAESKWTLDDAREGWQSYVKDYGTDFDPVGLQTKLNSNPQRDSKKVASDNNLPEASQLDTVSDSPIISEARRAKMNQVVQELLKQQSPSEVQSISPVKRLTSLDLMPQPFAWIAIPTGNVTFKAGWFSERDYDLTMFHIAKYPVTNAQFARFIEAKGYENKKWWTDAGWETLQKEKWTQPLYWTDKKWNGTEHPVVGVSWFEAVAFCLWLSDVTGENIMLPTEAQWQYAAQGDDNRIYPWGNEWDCQRCNNSISPCDSDKTTPVRQYEGKGDSPFGVVDMLGNVWEWCLTDYRTNTNDLNSNLSRRVLRGGSYFSSDELLRVFVRFKDFAVNSDDEIGFRIVRSQ